MNSDTEQFEFWGERDPSQGSVLDALIVDIDGFEGPLDVLLTLCRTQKVDLRKVSILQLANQYLKFVETAKLHKLELAADYLVMAAWLAYLKSRLLLPVDPQLGPSGEELAAYLAFQLERLSAMRIVAAKIMTRDRLGTEFFGRGMLENVIRTRKISYSSSLLDLMQSYARVRTRDEFRPYIFDRLKVFTMEEALTRMRKLIGFAGGWTELSSYIPEGWSVDPDKFRSATASNFAASLELVKAGEIELRQEEFFDPIQVRKK